MSRLPVVVRDAVLGEAEAIAQVHVSAWRVAYRGLMPADYLDGLDVAQRADAWRERLSGPADQIRILVAVLGRQIVGFASFGDARDATSGSQGQLYAIYVHPHQWAAGVGSALLSQTHTGLIGLGHRQAVLWVMPGNARARGFYERHGWASDEIERTIDLGGVLIPVVRYSTRLASSA